MFNKRKSSFKTLLIITAIAFLSFNDLGIFISNFAAKGDDGSQVDFKEGEKTTILRENERDFFVEKDLKKYEVPKDVVLIKGKNSNSYKVKKKNTPIIDGLDGKTIKLLDIGEKVKLKKLSGEYGLFSTADNIEGYILLADLEEGEREKIITVGIAKNNKVLKGAKDRHYVLLKGEPVLVKDFKNGQFIIVDEEGNEFSVNKGDISLRNGRHTTSRSGISRRTSKLSSVIHQAHKTIGKPYVSGDIGKRGYDCSGLTYSTYLKGAGIKLNRSSKDQVKNGVEVKKSDLIPGDLVFFRTGGRNIGHVGIYVGDGNMIHASSGSKKVIITPIDEKWYKQRYVTARRIIK